MISDASVLQAELIRDEGLRLKPYLDTAGKWTIGVGRNLSDRGITRNEALILLDNDILVASADLNRNIAWWRDLSSGRRRALLNMAFNMGWARLSGFQTMLGALQSGAYEIAADEAIDSVWARQVGDRAVRIGDLIRRG
jgi:lysozyme